MMPDREEMIKHMQLARESHIDWARHQEACRRAGKPQVPHVGSASFHRRWVHIYDDVIAILREGA